MEDLVAIVATESFSYWCDTYISEMNVVIFNINPKIIGSVDKALSLMFFPLCPL
jgi:hypothetical protein